MEKIQSAIAKARAAREGVISGLDDPMIVNVAPVPTPPAKANAAIAAPVAPSAPTLLLSTEQVLANWARLEQVQPNARQMQRSRIVAFQGGKEAVTFDVMRTKVLQQMRANNWRRLAITSPGAGCGKSTTSLNLAFSLSRQPEVRTVVAEVDLRRPSLAKILGLQMQHSFAEVLEGTCTFDQNAMRYGNNLCFATNPTPIRNPSELLQNARVSQILADIEARFEPTITIFDMPPMLVSDDAMAFVGQMDCVLLVAAAETTTISEVDVCERDLASQTNVLGVVLNKCRYMDRKYGYSYYG